jgi:hypothetical protein
MVKAINPTNGSISKGLITLFIVIGVLVFLLFSGYQYYNGLRTECIRLENNLTVQYLDNQNMLSEFVSGFYEQIGIANLKSEKMDKILTDAISGRYGEDGFSANGAFYAAVKEAYPDLSALNIYDKIVDYVRAKRTEFKNIQSKLLSELNIYQNWRQEGAFRSMIIEYTIGTPTDRLQARIGKSTLKGQAALDKMFQIVLTKKAINAYESGEMEPLMPTK